MKTQLKQKEENRGKINNFRNKELRILQEKIEE